MRYKSDFERINKKGKPLRYTKWILLKYVKNELGVFRYGFSISKKVGKANLRNKFKRWFREILRASLLKEKVGVDLHVIVLPIKDFDFKAITYEDVNKIIIKSFENIRKDFYRNS